MASHRQRPTNEDLDGGLKNYPFVRFAKSRKIQKGEDFESATVDARWVSKSILNRRRRRRRHRKSEEEEEEETEEETAALERACSVEFVFLSLFDGHGGKDCADFCAKETLPCLLKALNSLEAELKKEEKLKVVETNEVRLSLSLYFFFFFFFPFCTRERALVVARFFLALCASSFSSLSGRFARAFLLTFFYFFHRRATESGGRVRVPSSAGVEVGV
jgi:hypothetical protein